MRNTTKHRLFLSLSLPVVLSAAACGSPELDDPNALAGLSEDDVVFAPEHDREVPFQPSATGTQVIFLNFDGGIINGCPSTNRYCSDVTTVADRAHQRVELLQPRRRPAERRRCADGKPRRSLAAPPPRPSLGDRAVGAPRGRGPPAPVSG